MDKAQKQTFDWLPAQMPRVAALMKTRRTQDGDAHVKECWRRRVVLCEPGVVVDRFNRAATRQVMAASRVPLKRWPKRVRNDREIPLFRARHKGVK